MKYRHFRLVSHQFGQFGLESHKPKASEFDDLRMRLTNQLPFSIITCMILILMLSESLIPHGMTKYFTEGTGFVNKKS